MYMEICLKILCHDFILLGHCQEYVLNYYVIIRCHFAGICAWKIRSDMYLSVIGIIVQGHGHEYACNYYVIIQCQYARTRKWKITSENCCKDVQYFRFV